MINTRLLIILECSIIVLDHNYDINDGSKHDQRFSFCKSETIITFLTHVTFSRFPFYLAQDIIAQNITN